MHTLRARRVHEYAAGALFRGGNWLRDAARTLSEETRRGLPRRAPRDDHWRDRCREEFECERSMARVVAAAMIKGDGEGDRVKRGNAAIGDVVLGKREAFCSMLIGARDRRRARQARRSGAAVRRNGPAPRRGRARQFSPIRACAPLHSLEREAGLWARLSE